MMRADIVTEARTWVDTRFAHQGHTKGLATDCAGFIGGVGVAVGAFAANVWEAEFAEHAGYGRTPANGMLQVLCRRFMRSIATAEAQAGDVLLMRFATEPQHLGILAPYEHGGLSLIHAYSRARKVVEHRLDDVWRSRVVEAFALPGVA